MLLALQCLGTIKIHFNILWTFKVNSAAPEASVDGAFTDGSAGSGNITVSPLASCIFSRPFCTWEHQRNATSAGRAVKQSINAKIKTPTRHFSKEGREAGELRSDRMKNMSKSCWDKNHGLTEIASVTQENRKLVSYNFCIFSYFPTCLFGLT